ncbi:MAG: GDSL-type esterase/lipase family protein [Spirochaetota bacterium]
MKRITMLLALFIMPLVFVTCGGDDSDKDDDAKIVCLGDSLTAGYSAVTNYVDDKTKSYPAYLQEKVTAEVINAGVTNETTAQAYARLQDDVISENPDIVVVCLGGNDFFFADDATGFDEALSDMQTYLEKIVNDLDTEKRIVFIAKFYNEDIARAKLAEKGVTDITAQTTWISDCDAMFDGIVSMQTDNLELVLVDDIWAGVYDGTGTLSTDFVPHPNAAGYKVMADNYFTVMKPFLEELDLVK